MFTAIFGNSTVDKLKCESEECKNENKALGDKNNELENKLDHLQQW